MGECGTLFYMVVRTMFMGEFEHTLDDKGRLTVPAKMRGQLGETFIITRGFDGCLFVYPRHEWHTIEDKVKKLPMTKKEARIFARLFFSGAIEVKLDRQGRVHIPQHLLQYAQIMKHCMLIGVATRVEIWAQETWQTYVEASTKVFNDITEDIVDFDG